MSAGRIALTSIEHCAVHGDESASGTPRPQVMIVDDDPAIVKALAFRCRKIGVDAVTAPDGLQAVLKAKRALPRLLILDIAMPGLDGFKVCEWLLDPRRPSIDVVVLTGRSDLDIVERCERLGVYFVPKNGMAWQNIETIIRDTFPRDELAAPSSQVLAQERAAADAFRMKRNKILIVEDDADFARGLQHRLSKCGAVTFHASNGIAGYRAAVRELPDLILADYVMPDGGGHYLLWRLNSTPETKRIPVFILSGQTFPQGVEHSFQLSIVGREGAVEFFQKPVDMDRLLRSAAAHCTLDYPAAVREAQH
jgi:CheY-like chemotaxis protein